jgi:hypothetical protein
VRTINWTTYAIETNGAAWAWGSGFEGQLGNGANTNAQSPVRICWPILRSSSVGSGNVSPRGIEVVAWGSTNTFTLAPHNWFHLAALSVDGTNVGTPNSYTFTNVAADHTMVATYAPDLAANNTPKWWLAQANPAWINNFDAAAMADQDGDGVPTWAEYIAGTDPMEPLSRLVITVGSCNNQLIVTLPTVAAGTQYEGLQRYYTIETATNLGPTPGWQAVAGCTGVRGEGQTVVWTNLAASPPGFFRAKVYLAP